MNENQPNNSKFQIRLPLVLCIGLAAGVLIGANFNSPTASISINNDVQKLKEVLGLIKDEYVDEASTDVLIEDAIQHMLTKLDPHSSYISVADRIEANEDLQGNFEGIGIEFNIFHDTIVVVSPLSGGPSEAAGLRSGDKIIKVDGKLVVGIKITNADVMKNLKGPKGSEVKLEVARKGSDKLTAFTIVRDRIPQFSIDGSYMLDEQTGYIKVNRFSQTTYEEFQKALATLKADGMKRLVLDLQANPGGYMNQAIDLADEFLPQNEKIVFTKGKDKRYNSDAMSTDKGEFEQGDLIVLINEGSASASEILAGALQDNDRALIVGRRSFGKGLVQSPFELSDKSELRLTISRYYTPSGRSIQKPYGTDESEYGEDIMKRFKHGEFFTADSIKFNDSLKYKTTAGRTVYGGGGIMPDYFVPLDTTINSKYLNALYNSNSMQEYTFNYSEGNKSDLEKMGLANFKKDFTVTDQMLDKLMATGKSNGTEPNLIDFRKNKRIFQLHVKALIARKIWGNAGYLPIINETNEILQQAMKMFDHVPELNRSKM